MQGYDTASGYGASQASGYDTAAGYGSSAGYGHLSQGYGSGAAGAGQKRDASYGAGQARHPTLPLNVYLFVLFLKCICLPGLPVGMLLRCSKGFGGQCAVRPVSNHRQVLRGFRLQCLPEQRPCLKHS